jgi:hypothetical protein
VLFGGMLGQGCPVYVQAVLAGSIAKLVASLFLCKSIGEVPCGLGEDQKGPLSVS